MKPAMSEKYLQAYIHCDVRLLVPVLPKVSLQEVSSVTTSIRGDTVPKSLESIKSLN